MIFIIGGKAGVGKDTFSATLKSQIEQKGDKVVIMHFADRLKSMCVDYLGWDGRKNDAGRTLLQQFGTDDVRGRFPNFWVEDTARTIMALSNRFNHFIVSDFRFKNECFVLSDIMSRIGLQVPVCSVKITRDSYVNQLTPAQQKHPSETDLDDFNFNYNIHIKTDGEEYLKNVADKFLEDLTTLKYGDKILNKVITL